MNSSPENDLHFMGLALNEARKAEERGEVPVGAVLVLNGEVIAASGNGKEASNLATHHAEILVLEEASRRLKRWRLSDCELYVSLEPCAMCAGALVQARLKRLVFGAFDPKAGAVKSLYQLLSDSRLNHQVEVLGGVMQEECGQILSEFFKKRRAEK